MKYSVLLIFVFFSLNVHSQNNYTQYVNPFVGTDGHGHTFPGATAPFAMVQLSPDTRIDGSWDGCSGYHYSDSFIYGFSHTHLSGTGCSDYGDIAFMPTFVSKPIVPIETEGKLFYSFSHKNEKASPGYYSVLLDNGIKVELSSTTRVGIQKYTYSQNGYAWITLDLKHRDELLEGKISQIDKKTFSGLRRSKAWAEDQLLYYYFNVSREAHSIKIIKNDKGDAVLYLGYWVKKGESILIKTALSSVDENGAKLNLEKEMNHWDFNKVKLDANASWDKELNKIQVFGGTSTEKQNFYTSMYHCMIHPNVMNDVDGRYRGRDKQIHKAEGFDYYTVFSLWDTYRALHPLLNLIDKKRSHDFMMTFKAQYEQSGRLPMWELWGNETNCMIGFHSVSVIWNSYVNGVIDKEELKSLWPAVQAEANSNRSGLDKFRKRGYLTVEDENESVSKTMEYAFNMHCVYNIHKVLFPESTKADSIYKNYKYAWVNLYNQETGFMTPRSNGDWIRDFDPAQVNNHFTEANAWQYAFAVQGDLELIADDSVLSKLFNADSKTSGREQADITGMIGQYAHGNEPSHHVAYMFSSADSIVKYVNKIRSELYHPTPDGLCGNEDCGQMSAWYVFSAMGFYPVDPSTARFTCSEMLFDSVRISLSDKRSEMVRKYVEDWKKFWSRGCKELSFNETKGYSISLGLRNLLHSHQVPVAINVDFAPLVRANGEQVFDDSLTLVFLNPQIKFRNGNINRHTNDFIYTLDTGFKEKYWKKSKGDTLKIVTNKNIRIKAGNVFTDAIFVKRPNNYDVRIASTYNSQYSGGGDRALIDGLKGDADWRKGKWQGYQGQDFEVLIDLKAAETINVIKAGFLQDSRSWILYPRKVLVYGSVNGSDFELIGFRENTVPDSMMNSLRMDFDILGNGKSYRYLKFVAINYGKLPQWHQGAGGDAFIFIDEIEIY